MYIVLCPRQIVKNVEHWYGSTMYFQYLRGNINFRIPLNKGRDLKSGLTFRYSHCRVEVCLSQRPSGSVSTMIIIKSLQR
ncbi:unnamed protein product [Brugia timori]|uniref:Ovule protein n=1 Tax=Brugia timori TaxID=42155 RepID=A0A0R3Q9G2_9BILA|nr:unnamed protein product [Brugia timori]